MAVRHETTSEWTLSVVAVSCALHATEEYLTGWQEWARQTLGIIMPTTRFLAVNAILVMAALLLARVGWRRPALSLLIPSATLVNAVFFQEFPQNFWPSQPNGSSNWELGRGFPGGLRVVCERIFLIPSASA
jgi:hypothetical protein